MKNTDIKKVIVVFKTHLDIGFTGLARDVLAQYVNKFIPHAVELAFAVNTPQKKRFVWTVGAYLVKYYLQHAPAAALSQFEKALRLGYIRWHGLACTTHTELMDESLLEYSLSIAKNLDEAYGQKTIAAKMTDVPGHTIAMMPALQRAGIAYLHIGVNDSSRLPEVPELFLWKYKAHEVIVHYADSYGKETVLEKQGVVLTFAHTHDNCGPQDVEEIDRVFSSLQEKYPAATVEAGTLDDFAHHVAKEKSSLWCIDEEIGDTWIHGVASDPLKTSQLRRLLTLHRRWQKQSALIPSTPGYEHFMDALLLVCEHTWGMDTKKYLLDFTNWEKNDFRRAREIDKTSVALFKPEHQSWLQNLLPELRHHLGEELSSSYSRFEASHAEQRAYMQEAVMALPAILQQEATAYLQEDFYPCLLKGRPAQVGEMIAVGVWQVAVGASGELSSLHNVKNGFTSAKSFAEFGYSVYEGAEVEECYHTYGRNIESTYFWSYPDFAKPGLPLQIPRKPNEHNTKTEEIWVEGNCLHIVLRTEENACENFGCPRRVQIVHTFEEDAIRTSLHWAQKDASRIPESLWLRFTLECENPNLWKMQKMGQDVSPLHVVRGGSRKLHCVESMHYHGADADILLQSLDAPLISVGCSSVYDVQNTFGNVEEGLYFILYNNRWGTNFKQWFAEDMRFDFVTQIKAVSAQTKNASV